MFWVGLAGGLLGTYLLYKFDKKETKVLVLGFVVSFILTLILVSGVAVLLGMMSDPFGHTMRSLK